mgnify:CR=1 FL=1
MNEQLSNIIQENYQRIAPEIILKHSDIGRIEKIGRYWDNKNEIDNIGLNYNTGEIFFIESKWSNKLIGVNILDELIAKAKTIDWNRDNHKKKYVLLSKSGFTQEIIKASKKDKNIILIQGNKII